MTSPTVHERLCRETSAESSFDRRAVARSIPSVSIAGATGTVESVNMRVTMRSDLEGRVHFIPNVEIKAVTNRTYRWGRAVLDIPVGYYENVDRVIETLSGVAAELRADPDWAERITEDPIMMGVDAFTEYGVVIKFMLKTTPEDMFTVRRELLRRVKNGFDEFHVVLDELREEKEAVQSRVDASQPRWSPANLEEPIRAAISRFESPCCGTLPRRRTRRYRAC